MKYTKDEIEHARESMLKALGNARKSRPAGPRASKEPVPELLCKVTHVSKSGLSRSVECYVVIQDAGDGQADLQCLSGAAAKILGLPYDRQNGGVRVGGVGMDMTFWLASTLGTKLYGDAYAINRVQI